MFTPTESVTEDAGDEGTVSSKGRGHQYEQIQKNKQKKKKNQRAHICPVQWGWRSVGGSKHQTESPTDRQLPVGDVYSLKLPEGRRLRSTSNEETEVWRSEKLRRTLSSSQDVGVYLQVSTL